VLASDFTKNVDHSFDNVLRNNLVLTRRPANACVYVDPFTSRRTREMAGNLYHHAGGGQHFVWNRNNVPSLAAWNALKPGGPDLSADPLLADIARLAGETPDAGGARPRLASLARGLPISMPVPLDLLGTALTGPPVGALLPRP